jgi:hypothetical protein
MMHDVKRKNSEHKITILFQIDFDTASRSKWACCRRRGAGRILDGDMVGYMGIKKE